MDKIAEIAGKLTKAERDALIKHHRTTEDRWLLGDFLGEHGCELLYHRSLTLELEGHPPLWERKGEDSFTSGVCYKYRPGAVLGLAVRNYLNGE